MNLFVWNADMDSKVPVSVSPATMEDLRKTETESWQTHWTSKVALNMPNKVALHRCDTNELLGLMSYDINEAGLAVEIVYIEGAAHSNGNLLGNTGTKKYFGIAKALFAYAVSVSIDSGFGGVVFFKAKTSELREYYIRQFNATPLGSYDPFRLIIWEDAAQRIVAEFLQEEDCYE